MGPYKFVGITEIKSAPYLVRRTLSQRFFPHLPTYYIAEQLMEETGKNTCRNIAYTAKNYRIIIFLVFKIYSVEDIINYSIHSLNLLPIFYYAVSQTPLLFCKFIWTISNKLVFSVHYVYFVCSDIVHFENKGKQKNQYHEEKTGKSFGEFFMCFFWKMKSEIFRYNLKSALPPL